MKMCEALASLGHEVELNYPIEGGGHKALGSDPHVYYGVHPTFSLRLIRRPSMRGARYYFAVTSALRARFRGVRLAFCRNYWAAYFCARFGISTVFEAHAPIPDDDRVGLRLFEALIRISKFRRLFVITNSLREHYLSRFPELKGKVDLLPDAASFVPSETEPESLGFASSTLKVGYVGQLYPGKGMELIAQLAPLCPAMSFHIVGGQENDLAYWRRECSSVSNLVFHGYVSHARVPGFIKAIDVVLLPNQTFVAAYGNGNRNISDWTSPLKMFEYMAAGKAIVASNLPVLREVLRDGENALLCSPAVADEWRIALERLVADPALKDRIASAAHAEFLQSYSWGARARKALEIAG